MQVELKSLSGKTGSVDLSENIFSVEFNRDLTHQIVVSYQARGRQGTKSQKNRAAVAGGGAKPWKQKGTGRARAGTSSSPIWRSGGVTFAATNRDFSKKVNKKMYRAGMRSIFSELLRNERLIIVDDFVLDDFKTKTFLGKFKEWSNNSLLLVDTEIEKNIYLAGRNVIGVNMTDVNRLDPVSLVSHDYVLISEKAIKTIEERLS